MSYINTICVIGKDAEKYKNFLLSLSPDIELTYDYVTYAVNSKIGIDDILIAAGFTKAEEQTMAHRYETDPHSKSAINDVQLPTVKTVGL